MRENINTIDLSVLPEAARREVVDYYHFVVQRYEREQYKGGRHTTKKLPAEFYKAIPVKEYLVIPRDEMYNDR